MNFEVLQNLVINENSESGKTVLKNNCDCVIDCFGMSL